MTISVHDLPPGNRPVDVVASNRQLPSLVPHKRELHQVSQPIEQAPQKYFFLPCCWDVLSGTRWTTSGACSQWTLIWRGWSSSQRWRPRSSLFTQRRLQVRYLPSLCCNILLSTPLNPNANDSLKSYFWFFSQFHPEKNMFEWAPWHTSIPHSRQSQQYKVGADCYQQLMKGREMSVKQYLIREATSVSLYMVEYFVEEARKSSHQFPSRWSSIRKDGDK